MHHNHSWCPRLSPRAYLCRVLQDFVVNSNLELLCEAGVTAPPLRCLPSGALPLSLYVIDHVQLLQLLLLTSGRGRAQVMDRRPAAGQHEAHWDDSSSSSPASSPMSAKQPTTTTSATTGTPSGASGYECTHHLLGLRTRE